jgi:hypothetical protein
MNPHRPLKLTPTQRAHAIDAARAEFQSWVNALEPASFAETHGITETEARAALRVLQDLASNERVPENKL